MPTEFLQLVPWRNLSCDNPTGKKGSELEEYWLARWEHEYKNYSEWGAVTWFLTAWLDWYDLEWKSEKVMARRHLENPKLIAKRKGDETWKNLHRRIQTLAKWTSETDSWLVQHESRCGERNGNERSQQKVRKLNRWAKLTSMCDEIQSASNRRWSRTWCDAKLPPVKADRKLKNSDHLLFLPTLSSFSCAALRQTKRARRGGRRKQTLSKSNKTFQQTDRGSS